VNDQYEVCNTADSGCKLSRSGPPFSARSGRGQVQQTAPVAASIRLCSREDRASRWVALIVQAVQLLQIPVAKD
jgi:hypothetical protein